VRSSIPAVYDCDSGDGRAGFVAKAVLDGVRGLIGGSEGFGVSDAPACIVGEGGFVGVSEEPEACCGRGEVLGEPLEPNSKDTCLAGCAAG